ncbi:MAG: PAS domain S-box protein [candidate division Zixibacteria bacterium]|nr:PAS domain S-box protein [candidate division Zixibacteria bacterium]
MKLIYKVLLTLGAVLAVGLALNYYTINYIIQEDYDRIANDYCRESIRKGVAALDLQAGNLSRLAHNWASRNEIYDRMPRLDYDYLEKNFTDKALNNQNIDLIEIFNRSGKLIYHREHGLSLDNAQSPLDIDAGIFFGPRILWVDDSTIAAQSLDGIISTREGPMLFASRPILPSDENGEHRGTLVMGRCIDNHIAAQAGNISGSPVKFLDIRNSSVPHILFDKKGYKPLDRSVVVNLKEYSFIEGYTLINDISGKPAFVMSTLIPKNRFIQGQQNVLFNMTSVIAIGLLTAITVIVVLYRILFTRLARLTESIAYMARTSKIRTSDFIDGKDELSRLGYQFKRLIEKLNLANQRLRESEEKSRSIIKNSPVGITLLDRDLRLLEVNPQMTRWFPDMKFSYGKLYTDAMKLNIIEQSRECPVAKAIEEGKTQSSTIIFRTNAGLKYFDVIASPIANESGEIIGIVQSFTDITKQLLAENKLKQKNKELSIIGDIRSAANSAKDMQELCMLIANVVNREIDFDLTAVYLNDEKKRLRMIYRTSDILSEHYSIDNEYITGKVESVKSTAEPYFKDSLEDFDSGNDNPIPVALAIVPIIYRKEILGLIVTGSDSRRNFTIDDRMTLKMVGEESGAAVEFVHARSTLQESENKYRELFENAGDVIFTMNLKGDIQTANRAALEFMGYSQKDLKKGVNISQLLTRSSYKIILQRVGNRVAGMNMNKDFTAEVVKKNGETALLEYKAELINKNGEPVGVQCVARDITRRIKSEETLRRSEEKYRALVESSDDVILSQDRHGRLTFLHLGAKFKDVDPQAMIGKHPSELIGVESAEIWMTNFRKVLRTNKPVHFYASFEFAGFNLRTSTTLSPIRNSDGRVVAVSGISKDITEHDDIQQRLAEKSSFLESLLKNTSDVIFALDNDLKITFAGESLKTTFGYQPDEVLGNTAQFLFQNVKDYADTEGQIKQSVSERGYFRGEVKLKDSRGNTIPVEATFAPIYNADGSKNGYAALVRNFTESYRLQKELMRVTREQESAIKELEKVRALLEMRAAELKRTGDKLNEQKEFTENVLSSIDDWVRVINEDFNVLYANKSVREKFGDNIGEQCFKIFGADERCAQCVSEKAIKEGRTVKKEISAGGRHYLLVSSPFYGESGKLTRAVEVIRDITEIKSLVHGIIELNQMALIGSLTASLTENINEKLWKISEMTDSAGEVVPSEGALADYLGEINRRTGETYSITDAILAYTAGDFETSQDIDLNKIIEDAVKIINLRYLDKELSFEIKTGSLKAIHANPLKIRQVLLNTLVAITECLEPKKKVAVKGANIDDCVELSFSSCVKMDPGLDIDKALSLSLAEEDWSGLTGNKLYDLGLAISKRIMEECGGMFEISFEKPDKVIYNIRFPIPRSKNTVKNAAGLKTN